MPRNRCASSIATTTSGASTATSALADEFDEWRSSRDKNRGGDASRRGASSKASDAASGSDTTEVADASSTSTSAKNRQSDALK